MVLEHGELPPTVLAEEFAEDETSVLCATMGMWAGLNVVGSACTLVVIDKIPFAPMDDPLSAARRANVDAHGGNGFKEIFVNHAALMLTQGRAVLFATEMTAVSSRSSTLGSTREAMARRSSRRCRRCGERRIETSSSLRFGGWRQSTVRRQRRSSGDVFGVPTRTNRRRRSRHVSA